MDRDEKSWWACFQQRLTLQERLYRATSMEKAWRLVLAHGEPGTKAALFAGDRTIDMVIP
jgi:hypothetical protein